MIFKTGLQTAFGLTTAYVLFIAAAKMAQGVQDGLHYVITERSLSLENRSHVIHRCIAIVTWTGGAIALHTILLLFCKNVKTTNDILDRFIPLQLASKPHFLVYILKG